MTSTGQRRPPRSKKGAAAPVPASVSHSTACGAGLRTCFAQIPATFSIHAITDKGVHCTTGGEPWVVQVRGVINMRADVTDLGNGQYSCKYVVGQTGQYQIQVCAKLCPGVGRVWSGSQFQHTWAAAKTEYCRHPRMCVRGVGSG